MGDTAEKAWRLAQHCERKLNELTKQHKELKRKHEQLETKHEALRSLTMDMDKANTMARMRIGQRVTESNISLVKDINAPRAWVEKTFDKKGWG